MQKTALAAVVVLCCAAPLLAGPPVEVIEGVGAAVTLDEPKTKLDSNAATVVSFTVRNDTSDRVTGYQVRIYRSVNGKLERFKTVVRRASIRAGESRREEVKLTWFVHPGDSLAVGLVAVTTPRGRWKAHPRKQPGVPRSLEGEWSRLTKPAEQAKVIPAVLEETEPPCTPPCEKDFCTDERAQCNFGCNGGNNAAIQCVYSFRCTRKCYECEAECVCKTNWYC